MADRMKITDEVPFTVKDFQGPDGAAEPDGLPSVSVSNPELATVVYDDETHRTGAIVATGKAGDVEVIFDAESGGKMLPRIVRHLTIVTDKPVALSFDAEVGEPKAARKIEPKPPVTSPDPLPVPPTPVPPRPVPPVPTMPPFPGGPITSPPPVVRITAPTTESAITVKASPVDLAGTASEGTVRVEWGNSRRGTMAGPAEGGRAEGTATWAARGIPVYAGINGLTITATDAAGVTTVASLTVTLEQAPVPPDPGTAPSTLRPS